MASLDPDFPISEWYRLVEQGELTLNLLRASSSNPKLSAFVYFFGEFNYSATPLVPSGTKTLVHSKLAVRTSWGINGEEGWTIWHSLQQYRCIKVYFPKTRSFRDIDTVTFFQKVISFPKVNTDDFLRQAAEDSISILTAPPTPKTPSLVKMAF